MVNPNTETSEKQTQYIMPSEIESKLKNIVHNILLNNKLYNPNVYCFKYYMYIYFIN